MKAKLIKKAKHFELISKDDNGEEFIVATSSDYAIKALLDLKNPMIYETIQIKKLSLKNCQAIENGYDLDELFNEVDESIDYHEFDFTSFRLGFQKALEILGDKKFSEKDLRTAYGVGYLMKINPSEVYHETLNGLVQLLQQTEWDVEIATECPQCQDWGYVSECKNSCNQKFIQPKLDADGCLILKRV